MPIISNFPGGGVDSFNGRRGAVLPASGDYTPQMVGADPEGSASEVQSNLENHINSKSNPHGVTAAQTGAVPTSRTVNGYKLTDDIELTAADVGATDTKVTQTVTTTSAEYPVLMSADAGKTTTSTTGARFAADVTVNPSTDAITAKEFIVKQPTRQTLYTAMRANIADAALPVIRIANPNDSGGSGHSVALGANGNTIIGSGESVGTLLTELLENGSEKLYLTADSDIFIYTNANTYANKKQVHISTGGVITAPGFSGDLTGNADTATTLETARTIQTNLGSTSAASFNGSANVTPGVTGTLKPGNGGTGKTSWTANRLIYASAATTLNQVAFPSVAGSVLRQNTSGAPYWTALDSLMPGKVAVKSYTGTGTSGANNPTVLTFSFAPKVIHMIGATSVDGNNYTALWSDNGYFLSSLFTAIIIPQVLTTSYAKLGIAGCYTKKSSDGKTISFYATNSSSPAHDQCNSSGYTYYFIAYA